MRKLILLILMIFFCAIMSINAFADPHYDDVTIAEDSNSYEECFDIFDSRFINDGTFRVVGAFSASKAACLNNGILTVTDGFTITNNSQFTNKGILTIDSVQILTINAGATFTNDGVVYLSNIESCDLSGTITGTGDFVYDETVSTAVVEALKAICFDKVIPSNDIKVDQSSPSTNNEGSDSTESGELGESAEVKAEYKSGTPESTVYKVDIAWGSLEFTYTDSSKGVWNPTTHKYDGSESAKWSWATGANEITVTNHSNAAITATASYTVASGYDTISLTFDRDTFTLATADNGVNGAAGTPTSDTISVTPRGALKKSEGSVVIGTITITIS